MRCEKEQPNNEQGKRFQQVVACDTKQVVVYNNI